MTWTSSLGLPGNAVLSRLVEITADDVRVRRAEAERKIVRRYTENPTPWRLILVGERRVAARIVLTNTYSIDAGGTITMPLIGSVPARGRTPASLAAESPRSCERIYP